MAGQDGFRGAALGVALDDAGLVLGGQPVLRGVTWHIAPGERWVLAGGNGAGKTQLCKLMAGERWPTPRDGARRGTDDGLRWVDARGREVDVTDALPRLVHVSGEHQDRYARRDWNLGVRAVIGTGFDRTDIPLRRLTRAESAQVTRAVRAFGLQRLARRRFLTLSYGERRRVLLARAWVARPALLLLDEPFNGLDGVNRASVQRALAVLLRRKCTVVLTTHRTDDRLPGFTKRAVLERGRLTVGRGGSRAQSRASPLLQGTALDLVGAGLPATGLTPNRASRASSLPQPQARPLVQLTNVDLYRDWRPVLRGLDWTVRRGEHWAIVGATGSGKSTLMQLLHGSLWPALGGEIRRAGHPPGTPMEDWKRRVGYVSPELQTLAVDDAMGAGTLEDLVIGGWRGSLGLDWPAARGERTRARAMLDGLGLLPLAARLPREVSYGQLRLALLARALVRKPVLLLLDEPFTGLDAGMRAFMRAELEKRAASGTTLVVAVHHAEDLPGVVKRVLRLGGGAARITSRR